eukprot:s419_g34.t1
MDSMDSMDESLAKTLQSFVEVISQKEGRSEEDVLKELGTPEGMKMFTSLMSMSATGAAGCLQKTQVLARQCGRACMYLDYIHKHCPWLEGKDDDEEKNASDTTHGCFFKDCTGKAQRLYFGLDLASANGYYASRFTMLMPKARWYASEHMSEPADYLGTKMMEDCIEYMAEESQEGLKRKRSHPGLQSSKAPKATKAEAEKSLLDSEESGDDSEEDEMQDRLCALDTESSRQSAKLLRGRTACVDITEETWHGVEHLQGYCSVVVCTSLLTQVGYRQPYIWADVLQGASQILEKDGILLMYDTEKWGDFGDVEKMKDQIKKAELDLELIEREEPVDFSDDPDGRMFTLAFKKTGASQRKSLQWLIQKAEDFKQAGNSYYSNLAKCRDAREQGLHSSPRVASLWKAVACYVQGLDCLSLARSQGDDERLNHISSRLYSNLAAAYIELAETAGTYEHANRVIDLALVSWLSQGFSIFYLVWKFLGAEEEAEEKEKASLIKPRFPYVGELSDAATAWVSTSVMRDPGQFDVKEAGMTSLGSQDVALQILNELEVRAAQISQLEENGRLGPGTTHPPSSGPSGHGDPWRRRQQMLSQEYVMIEESIVMLQRWNSLQPEARAQLLSNLRHLPQLRGEDATRVQHLGNEAEDPPYPRFLKQDQTTSWAVGEPRAGPSSMPATRRHGGVEVEEMARLWRTMRSQQENVSSVQVQAADPQGESEQLEMRLKTMTEFFAGHFRNEPR